MLIRVLSYFIPLAMNMLSGGVMFVCSYRFSEAGCSGLVTGGAVAAWGIVYCLTNFAINRVATPASAAAFILAGAGCMTAAAAGFLIFPGLYTQFLWIGLTGMGAGLFCMPFQLFAKAVESEKRPGTVPATAFYTFSWSVGFATGALFFARFVTEGFRINLGIALALLAAVIAVAGSRRNAPAAAREESGTAFSAVPAAELRRRDVYARLGWLIGGVGTLAVCIIRSMWPHHGALSGVPQLHIALTTALVSYTQAVTALLLYRSSRWMFRRLPAAAFSLAGAAGLLLFALGRTTATFYLAAAVYGVYSGCVYFYFVYHSLAHPARAGYFVSGNEVIVGVVSMTAPALGGLLADRFTSVAPFICAAGAIALAWAVQFLTVSAEYRREAAS